MYCGFERGEGGVPKDRPSAAPAPLSRKELFRRKCEALGLTDAAVIESLWPAEADKQAKARERTRKKKGRGK